MVFWYDELVDEGDSCEPILQETIFEDYWSFMSEDVAMGFIYIGF